MEPTNNTPNFSAELKQRIFRKLAEATTLEHFCATRYIGKKRFSLEGSESLIPMMSEIINELPSTYQTPTMAPFCKDEEKYQVVEELVKQVKETVSYTHLTLPTNREV